MPNHLANVTSPYLLQRADNPVDWYPWGEAALQKAKAKDKQIILSERCCLKWPDSPSPSRLCRQPVLMPNPSSPPWNHWLPYLSMASA